MLGKCKSEKNIFIILNEFKDNKEVILKAIKILESINNSQLENMQDEYRNIYFDIISMAKDYNETLKNIYIKMLLDKPNIYKYSEGEILDLLGILECKAMDNNEVLKIISIVIKYYINNKNNNEALRYFKTYLEELSSIDDGELFREILSSYNNLDFTESILREIDFTKIEKVDLLLNLTFDRLIENNRYELLIEILRYYNDNSRYNEGLYVLKGYINNISYIDSLIYEVFILPMLRNINQGAIKEIYDILILRDDLPIEIREEFYHLNRDEYNTNKIISDFRNYITDSSLSKNLSLRKYYDYDTVFEELISRGNNDNETCNIVFEKVKEKFKNDKGFVELIITDEIANLREDLREIRDYAIDYNNSLFEPEKCNVFGEYLVTDRLVGALCEEVNLENIFVDEDITAIRFKDNTLYDIYTKYLNNNKIKFNVIDIDVINMSSDIKMVLPEEMLLVDILKSFNKLVKLENLLMNNGMIMLDFTKDSFKFNGEVFILNSFTNICKYSGEEIFGNYSIFKDIDGIKNRNNRIVINERNIVKIMCHYIKQIVSSERKTKDTEIDKNVKIRELAIRDKFIAEILSKEISSLNDLYDDVNLFIDKESKEFEELSYRKQIKTFKDISLENKIKVICKAIKDKDTTPDIKNKVIYFEHIPKEITEEYFKYIIDCNNNTLGLKVEDYGYIYDKVTELINSSLISKEIIDDQVNEISMLYINARRNCKYQPMEIIEDVDSIKYSIDKEYIKSRIN